MIMMLPVHAAQNTKLDAMQHKNQASTKNLPVAYEFLARIGWGLGVGGCERERERAGVIVGGLVSHIY